MSRGLGELQRRIKEVMNFCAAEGEPLVKPNDLYKMLAVDENLQATENERRSIRRALKNLVERDEVLHISKNADGSYSAKFFQSNRKTPGKYITIEVYIGLHEGDGSPLEDVEEAKRIWSKMIEDHAKTHFQVVTISD